MNDLIMSEDEWKQHARQVVADMQDFTAPFVSAVSYEKSPMTSLAFQDLALSSTCSATASC
ncbi:hypothetical protein AZ09_13870 [Acetobacter aceti 1023]|nr:hypothetical protein AZ09_13870 [Acetobacter aceti 1023]